MDPERYHFQSMMSDCCAVALNGKNVDLSNCEILLTAFVSGMTETMPLQNDDDVNRMFLLHGDRSQIHVNLWLLPSLSRVTLSAPTN